MKNQRGFTLIEMVLSLVILATIFVAVAQATKQAVQSKKKIQEQIDDMSRMRDTLRVIERDVNLAFHYRDLERELQDEIKKTNNPTPKTPPAGTPFGFQQPVAPAADTLEANPNRKDPTTHFFGKEDEMAFATLNVGRMNENQAQADFSKVGYAVTTCQKPGEPGSSEKCLIRKTANIVEGDIAKGGDSTVMLEGVQEFTLRYLGKSSTEWARTWDSSGQDGASKNSYPEAVEISLTVERGEGERKKKISMQIVATVRFSNNRSAAP